MLKISACTIAKNEEKNIGRWVDNVRSFADEIIVVDTGSQDRTREIAISLGASLYEFAWCDDFAAAKNYALSQCKGDWVAFLDADEFFDTKSQQKLRVIISKYDKEKKIAGFMIPNCNIDEHDGNKLLSKDWRLRLFRREDDLRYAGRVHESLQDTKLTGAKRDFPLLQDLQLYHTGYSGNIIEDKLQRNLKLLLADIRERGSEKPWHYGYLQDCYAGLGDYAKAIHYGRLALKYRQESGITGQTNSIICRLLNSVRISGLGDYAHELRKAIREFPDYPEVNFYYGQYLLSQMEGVRAEQALLKALQLYNKPKNNSDDIYNLTFADMEAAALAYLQQIERYRSYYEAMSEGAWGQAADVAAKWLSDAYASYSSPMPEGYLFKSATDEKRELKTKSILTSIIILNFNLKEYMQGLLDSIRRYTTQGTYEIIVVDNGSHDGSVEWLQKQPDVRLIANRENVGFPRGCNQGLAIAQGDELLLLNNDVVVTHHWLDNLRQALYSAPGLGAVGPVTNNSANMQAIDIPYPNENTQSAMAQMQEFAAAYNISDSAKWQKWMRLVGFCMLFRREVYAKIGDLDESYSPGNYEDDDYCLRIRRAGYEILLCRDTFVHHFGSKTFNVTKDEAKIKYESYNEKNREYFCRKWCLDNNWYGKYRTFLSELAFTDEFLRIIEYGANSTLDLYILGTLCPRGEITGTTGNRYDLSIGSSYPLRYAPDLSSFVDMLDGEYNLIIIPYDFESVADNNAFLSRIEAHLQSGGWLIAVNGGKLLKMQKE